MTSNLYLFKMTYCGRKKNKAGGIRDRKNYLIERNNDNNDNDGENKHEIFNSYYIRSTMQIVLYVYVWYIREWSERSQVV